MIYNEVPCPGCGEMVVIVVTRRHRRHPGEMVLKAHKGGPWKINTAGSVYRVKANRGDYIGHRCRPREHASHLRPTQGFRLDTPKGVPMR